MRQRDQPLLRAVVQVALDPAALDLERVHQPGPGPGHLDQLLAELGVARREDRPGQRGPGAGPGRHRVGGDRQQAPARARQRDDAGDRDCSCDVANGRATQQRDRACRATMPSIARSIHHSAPQRHHRVAELPPGRRLPQPGTGPRPQPAGAARHRPVRVGQRVGVDQPQPPPLEPGRRRRRTARSPRNASSPTSTSASTAPAISSAIRTRRRSTRAEQRRRRSGTPATATATPRRGTPAGARSGPASAFRADGAVTQPTVPGGPRTRGSARYYPVSRRRGPCAAAAPAGWLAA